MMFSYTDYAVFKAWLVHQFVDGKCNIHFTELTPVYKETCFVLVNMFTH